MMEAVLKHLTGFFLFAGLGVACTLFSGLHAQAGAQSTSPTELPRLEIDGSQVSARVSPMLYGLMTEEINYSYDGGLYGELVRNRVLKDDPGAPVHWSVVQSKEGDGKITLDESEPLNDVLTSSLKLEVSSA